MRSFRERSPVLVGFLSLVLLAVGVTLAFSVNRFEGLRGVYVLYADLEDASGLRPGNEVRVAGVKVGQVKGLTLQPDAARAKFEIRSSVLIPRETLVEVKLKTLLGQKFVDLQVPRRFRAARLTGDDPVAASGGFFDSGDVIPRDQTEVPFDIYQAATEGTAVLAEIDKRSLRKMLKVLASTTEAAEEDLGPALKGVAEASDVLGGKSAKISRFLRNAETLSATLAGSGEDIGGILERSSEVLGTLAEQRAAISSLLQATNSLGENLGSLVQVARGSVQAGFTDLGSVLKAVEGDMESLETALQELGDAQRMFAQPGQFGRFLEAHACAATSADTCVPIGSPENPGVPVHNIQPQRTGAMP